MNAQAPLAGLLEVTKPVGRTITLDEVDRRLLSLLAADSRISQRKLAAELHMSPPAVGDRIARLERDGVIRGYTVNIDWAVLGFSVVYLTVAATPGAAPDVLRGLSAIPEVEDVVVITGSFDMLARLRVRDHEHLRRVLMSEIWRIEGLQRTETFIGLGEMLEREDHPAGMLERLEPAPQADGKGEEQKCPTKKRSAGRVSGK